MTFKENIEKHSDDELFSVNRLFILFFLILLSIPPR